jgi:5-methylthioribose kinase
MQDTLDIEQPASLIAYLRDNNRIARDETPTIRVLVGGVSNRTVLVERDNGDAWVLKQALAKLRVNVDWFSDPARVHREALGLAHLAKLAPPRTITPLVFEDEPNHLLAMQAVPPPHENWKTMLLAGRVEADHVDQFARLLGTIHHRAHEHRTELSNIFDDRQFFESLRVEPYYEYTATRVPDASEFYARLIADTRARRLTLVHGDYSPKNVLVRDGRLILLDHEVIHWGEPAFDLGFGMTHLLSKAHHLPRHRTAFVDATRQFWRTYSESLGDVPWRADLEPHAVRHTLGCMLARVAGRSTLEYLNDDKRRRQREIVVTLMQQPPSTIDALVDAFVSALTEQKEKRNAKRQRGEGNI